MMRVTVESEYEKNKLLRKQDVMVLKEWAEKQPHLPTISELQLIFFLHSCYYSIEVTKTTIDSFFTFRTHCPELFLNRNPANPELQHHLKVVDVLALERRTPKDEQIVLFKFLNYDVDRFDFNRQVKIFEMTVVQSLLQNGTAESFIFVIDSKGLTLGHVLKMNIVSMKKSLMYLQDALFIRLMAIHLINVGSYMDTLMALMKPFLKKDLYNSLYFHTDSIKSLFEYVPVDYLPSDYGGLQPSLQELHEAKFKKLLECSDYFIEEDTMLCDDTKRVERPANLSSMFGVEGSFKKLDVD